MPTPPVGAVNSQNLSHQQAREIQGLVLRTQEMPTDVVTKRGMRLISEDNQIQMIIDDVMQENAKAVADYDRARNEALGYLIGKVREKSKGQVDLRKATDILRRRPEQA
jgi:aspartyl-tRNA(Asn)/glutamyl-tRNA(Gln) amidotransferase subunit B